MFKPKAKRTRVEKANDGQGIQARAGMAWAKVFPWFMRAWIRSASWTWLRLGLLRMET